MTTHGSDDSKNECLRIEGLGGLGSVELHLAKVNVLIGPQASGKSLAAKLIYFCKSYPKDMFSGILEGLTLQGFHLKLKERLVEHFGSAVASGSFSVCYQMAGETITVRAAKVGKSGRLKVEVDGAAFFDREYTTLRRMYGKQSRRLEEEESDEGVDLTIRLQMQFFHKVRKHFDGRWGIQQIFVPAGRSYFSFLQGSIFSLLSNNIPLDPFVREFGSSYERYKATALRPTTDAHDSLGASVEQILKGKYERERGEDYVISPDGRRVPLASSSSGQQEALPLLVMLQYFNRIRNAAVGRSVYVEEPEAHLFPDTQQQLVELLVHVLGTPGRNAQLVLTTHSPYVCAALNNLILAGDLVRSNNGAVPAELKKITLEGAYLDFDDLSVISLAGGRARSILDGEARLIDTRYLDAISEKIVHQREALLDIAMRGENVSR